MATPKAPSTKANTPAVEENVPDNGQATTASENTDSIVTDTDTTVESPLSPAAALSKEQSDHVNTLASASIELPNDETRVLMLEQMDHQRTLRQALGQVTTTDDDEELRKSAEENVQRLKDRAASYQPAKPEEIEAKPTTWSITAEDGGNISAVNRITGKTYNGPAADFLKKK